MSEPNVADLMARLLASEEARKEDQLKADERFAQAQQRSDDRFAQLIQNMQRPPVQQIEYRAAAPAAAEIRAEKIQKINFNIRKSNRLKPYRVSGDSDVKIFLKKFDEELQNMRLMVGMAVDLEDAEYVPIFRACLDFPVVERVGQVLTTLNKT